MVIVPISVNRQGNVAGIQYRTGIYYTDDSQLPEIEKVFSSEEEKAGRKLAVELESIRNIFSGGGTPEIPGEKSQRLLSYS